MMRKPDGQTLFLGTTVVGALLLIAYLVVFHANGQTQALNRNSSATRQLRKIPFDGQSSFQMLQRICALGPRFSGSPGMQRQQELLEDYFRQLGGEVVRQAFNVRHPENGSTVTMVNLIVRWHPTRTDRILLCAHYDTRPYPDRDPNPRRRRGVFIGANDGASGVAVLTELGKHMTKLESRYGVDFVLFDGEEFVFDDQRDRYFIGSEYFARQYSAGQLDHRYRSAVLLDMVGDANLTIRPDRLSMSWPDSRPLVRDIWAVARKLGVTEFKSRPYLTTIRDDHIMLHDVGGIPACDIIDFDYTARRSRRSYWHTEADTPDKCSPVSLAKVGWVVLEWLKQLK